MIVRLTGVPADVDWSPGFDTETTFGSTVSPKPVDAELACLLSPWYAAVIVGEPEASGVKAAWQVETPVVAVPVRVHVPLALKLPAPDGAAEKFTVPVGVVGVPASSSETVAVHVDEWPAFTEAGAHASDVEVERPMTSSPKPLELEVLCVLSPP